MNKEEIRISTIKSIIGAIPYFGTLMNEVFFEYRTRIQQKRIELLLNELNDKIKFVEINLLNQEYFETDEFYDLTIQVFDKAIKTKNIEKIKILANIYLNGIINSSDIENDRHSIILDFVLTIKSTQIVILKFIEENEKELKEIKYFRNLIMLFREKETALVIEEYEFKFYINDLENKGLITTEGGLIDYNDKTDVIEWQSSVKNSLYLTEFGKEFISFMK